MAPRRPRDVGTAAETATVRALRAHGFPHAERRALRGTADAGDITGTPGLCWEVKGGEAARTASDTVITSWLIELDQQRVRAGADIGILVTQRGGVGPTNAHRWWAWAWGYHLGIPGGLLPVRMLVADMCTVLRHRGYGQEMIT